jgi:hypothetical protein
MKRNVHSQRCSACLIDWPLGDAYAECPKCGGSTWSSSFQPDMDEAEAKYMAFEFYLERREQADRDVLERTEPAAFAQYLMDAAEEQRDRDTA